MSGPEFGLNLVTRLNVNYTRRNNLHETYNQLPNLGANSNTHLLAVKQTRLLNFIMEVYNYSKVYGMSSFTLISSIINLN